MSEPRWETQALLEDRMSEGRVDGTALQLVTVCLSDTVRRPSVVSHLRWSGARALAFKLLELAELADRGSEAWQ